MKGNGGIARATGMDERERPAALILVADDDGSIHSAVSTNNSRFAARSAWTVPDLPATPCAEEPPETAVCGTNVYVNFDFDSAPVRPESDRVLADVYARLVAEGADRVSIVGHTSSEGAEDYNLALSESRARAVVADLITRGFTASRLTATGLGESRPLVTPDANESARELNRRVEIGCG